MSFKSHSYSSDAFVRFFCYEQEKTSNGMSGVMKVRELVVHNDIINVSTSKTKAGAGSFNITLGSSFNFKSYISAGSWCMINISNNQLSGDETSSADGGLKMVGIVKSINKREMTDPETGTKVVRYTISGEDFFSVFNSQIYLNQILASGNDSRLLATVALGKLATKGSLNPGEIVRGLIDAIIGSGDFDVDPKTNGTTKPDQAIRIGVPIEVPNELFKAIRGSSGSLFSNMVIKYIQSNLLGKSSWLVDVGEQVSLWSMISNYANLTLNECYTEILPININGSIFLAPSFVMRAIPFSNKQLSTSQIMFNDHKTKVSKNKKQRDSQEVKQPDGTGRHYYISRQIYEDEILDMDYGKSDSERFNFFYVVPYIIGDQGTDRAAYASSFKNNIQAITNKPSQTRFGLRPFIANMHYMNNDPIKDAFLVTSICKDIWEYAYLYENGHIQIAGTPNHIPVGTNITLAERGWIAHVEGVSHSYSVSPDGKKRYTTTIAFSRLQNLDNTPIDSSESREANGQLGDWDRGISELTKTSSGKKVTKR